MQESQGAQKSPSPPEREGQPEGAFKGSAAPAFLKPQERTLQSPRKSAPKQLRTPRLLSEPHCGSHTARHSGRRHSIQTNHKIQRIDKSTRPNTCMRGLRSFPSPSDHSPPPGLLALLSPVMAEAFSLSHGSMRSASARRSCDLRTQEGSNPLELDFECSDGNLC